MPKTLSENIKKIIAGRQKFRCANKPGSKLRGLNGCLCPMYQIPGNDGSFNESGYDIDHIIEKHAHGSNHVDNLQALCPNCHAYKTRRYTSKLHHKNELISFGNTPRNRHESLINYLEFLNNCLKFLKNRHEFLRNLNTMYLRVLYSSSLPTSRIGYSSRISKRSQRISKRSQRISKFSRIPK